MPRTRRQSLLPSSSSSPLTRDPISELSTDEDNLMHQNLRELLLSSPFRTKRSSIPRKVDTREDALGDESLERMAWAEAENQAGSEGHTRSPPILAALSPNVETRRRRTPRKSKIPASGSSPPDIQTQSHSSTTRRKRSLPSLLDFSPKRRKSARISGELVITPPESEEKPSELLRLMGKTPTPAKSKRGRSSSQAKAAPRSAARLAGNPGASSLMYDVFSSSPLRQVTDIEDYDDQEDESGDDELQGDPTVTLCPGPIPQVVTPPEPALLEPEILPQAVNEVDANSKPQSKNVSRPVSKLASPIRRSRGDVRASTKSASIKSQLSPTKARLPVEAVKQPQPREIKVSKETKPVALRSPMRAASRSEKNPSLRSPEITLRQSPIQRAVSRPHKSAQQAVSNQVTSKPSPVKSRPAQQAVSKPSPVKPSLPRQTASKPSPVKPRPVRQKRVEEAVSSPKTSTKPRAIAKDASPGPSKNPSPAAAAALDDKPTQDDAGEQPGTAKATSPRGVTKMKSTRVVDGGSAQLLKDTLRASKSSPDQAARPSVKTAGKSHSSSPVDQRAEGSKAIPQPKESATRRPAQPKVSILETRSPERQVDRASPARVVERKQSASLRSASPAKPRFSPPITAEEAGPVPTDDPTVTMQSPAAVAQVDLASAATSSPSIKTRGAKNAASPARVKASPARVKASPARVKASPARVKASPARVKPSPAKVKASPAKINASPAKVKSSCAVSSSNAVKPRSPTVNRDAKAASVRTQQKPRTAPARKGSSSRPAGTAKEVGNAQLVPEGFRLTSTGSLVPIAPTLSKGEDLPFATSAVHQAKLQRAIEEEERIRKERSQVKAHTVPEYLQQRRKELEKECEMDLQREIEFIRQQEQGASGGASSSSKRTLPESLMGKRPRGGKGVVTNASEKPFVSSLEARHQERQAWEAKRKAREELLEHERRKARQVRERRDEEELRLERERRVVKAHPVPEHIYGKRGVSHEKR